jgi:hypothetical protein
MRSVVAGVSPADLECSRHCCHYRLFAHYRNQNFSPMWRAPVFKEKNALPRSELHFPIDNRYCLARARQYHPDVRGHVIAALRPVRKIIGIFRHEPIEERFQIAARGRIGILHHDEAATGVLNKNRHCPTSYSASVDLRPHIFGDFVQSFTFGVKFELVVMDMHYIADY